MNSSTLFIKRSIFIIGLALFALPAFASASVSVSIGNLSGTQVSVGTNVSFVVAASGYTNPTYAISDSLGGSSVSSGDINQSNGDFSWTPNGNDVGTHNLTVTVSDSSGDPTTTTQETITVTQAPSVSIQSLSPSTNITTSQTLTFNVVTTGFSSPTYNVSDNFSGSSVGNGNINSNGNFSWTPGSNQIGTHTITIDVTDSSGHNISASETVGVSATSAAGTSGTGGVTVQGLSPGTSVVVGQPVSFTVAASGFSNPAFSVSDSFGSGSTVSNADINTAGYFAWTPTSNDVGTHNLVVYANDSSGHTGNVSLSLTVNTPNIAITTINPGTTVLPNSQLTFTVSPQGFTNPSYTLSDSFANSTIVNSDINSSGQFSWTPATGQDGSHTVTVTATDASGHSAQTTITVVVNSGVSLALTAATPSSTVAPGTAVSFSAYAYGFTAPAYTVQDSFSGTSLTNAAINSSGNFYWIPTGNDAGTHNIIIYATDGYGHASSAQTTVTVSGTPSATATTANSSTLSGLETELDSLESQIAAQSGSASSVSSGFTFQNELTLGETSSDVTQLQNLLKQQGDFSGSATGYFGSLTQAAVEKFQTANGISPVGYVGPATREALNALLSGSSSTSTSASASTGDGYVFSNFIGYGQTSNDVTELQKRLTALGFYTGPITGYFGSLTRSAVEAFQGAHGIDQVGYVGLGTRAALNG